MPHTHYWIIVVRMCSIRRSLQDRKLLRNRRALSNNVRAGIHLHNLLIGQSYTVGTVELMQDNISTTRGGKQMSTTKIMANILTKPAQHVSKKGGKFEEFTLII